MFYTCYSQHCTALGDVVHDMLTAVSAIPQWTIDLCAFILQCSQRFRIVSCCLPAICSACYQGSKSYLRVVYDILRMYGHSVTGDEFWWWCHTLKFIFQLLNTLRVHHTFNISFQAENWPFLLIFSWVRELLCNGSVVVWPVIIFVLMQQRGNITDSVDDLLVTCILPI